MNITPPQPEMLTLAEIKVCELFAAVVINYRDHHDFMVSPCWTDEWMMGYFCALRDEKIINHAQWQFLIDAFQPKIAPNGETNEN